MGKLKLSNIANRSILESLETKYNIHIDKDSLEKVIDDVLYRLNNNFEIWNEFDYTEKEIELLKIIIENSGSKNVLIAKLIQENQDDWVNFDSINGKSIVAFNVPEEAEIILIEKLEVSNDWAFGNIELLEESIETKLEVLPNSPNKFMFGWMLNTTKYLDTVKFIVELSIHNEDEIHSIGYVDVNNSRIKIDNDISVTVYSSLLNLLNVSSRAEIDNYILKGVGELIDSVIKGNFIESEEEDINFSEEEDKLMEIWSHVNAFKTISEFIKYIKKYGQQIKLSEEQITEWFFNRQTDAIWEQINNHTKFVDSYTIGFIDFVNKVDCTNIQNKELIYNDIKEVLKADDELGLLGDIYWQNSETNDVVCCTAIWLSEENKANIAFEYNGEFELHTNGDIIILTENEVTSRRELDSLTWNDDSHSHTLSLSKAISEFIVNNEFGDYFEESINSELKSTVTFDWSEDFSGVSITIDDIGIIECEVELSGPDNLDISLSHVNIEQDINIDDYWDENWENLQELAEADYYRQKFPETQSNVIEDEIDIESTITFNWWEEDFSYVQITDKKENIFIECNVELSGPDNLNINLELDSVYDIDGSEESKYWNENWENLQELAEADYYRQKFPETQTNQLETNLDNTSKLMELAAIVQISDNLQIYNESDTEFDRDLIFVNGIGFGCVIFETLEDSQYGCLSVHINSEIYDVAKVVNDTFEWGNSPAIDEFVVLLDSITEDNSAVKFMELYFVTGGNFEETESDEEEDLPDMAETAIRMGLPTEIGNEFDLEKLIKWCIEKLGNGFHPDTPFDDYANLDTNESTFTDAESVLLDILMEQAFEKYGDKVYNFSYDLLIPDWKRSIIDKFMKYFLVDYDADAYYNNHMIDSDQVKYTEGKWIGNNRIETTIDFTDAVNRFKVELSKDEKTKVDIELDGGERADAEQHDEEKTYNNIKVKFK